ncbi:uncharacterized protein ZBIST_4653 [Zygosaccharomyces bailii]|nr:uncharacterized protein ZBIST_4653 [Zygosaccharomyces bailii]
MSSPIENGVEDGEATLRKRQLSSTKKEASNEATTVGLKVDTERSHKHVKSSSSLDVAAPVTLKSTPADPHLSDVNSVSSTTSIGLTALSTVNDIIEKDCAEKLEKEPLLSQHGNGGGNGNGKGSNKGSKHSSNKGSKHSSTSGSGNNSDNENKGETSNSDNQNNSTNGFFDNMISSFSFKSGAQPPPPLETQQDPQEEAASPSIISHRRQLSSSKKNGKKVSSPVSGVASPVFKTDKPKEFPAKTQLEEFNDYDLDRFVDETYLDTPFHFAVPERNAEFHALFKTIPHDDRLLDDFGCALSREFLYQGRLYISEKHLCFYSSLLGWIAKVIIPFKDITFMEKTSTAGLFQNAISLETETGKTQFNGFISRDIVFTLLKEVWARTLLAEGDKDNDTDTKGRSASSSISQDRPFSIDRSVSSNSITDLRRSSGPPSRASFISENDSIIEDAIRSVDDVTPTFSVDEGLGLKVGNEAEEGDEEDESDTASDTKNKSDGQTKKLCYKLKPDAHYKYDGPLRGSETQYKYSPENNKEFVLTEVELRAPPGIIFQLLFGGNPSFWLEFFMSQDSSKFSDFGEFDKVDEKGQKYREFEYAKGLHFPVGPKSTKCVVREDILHCDYADFIHVLNTTRTPDVPSGGSFSTKTRYMLRWASSTTCMLKVSYYMDWTAGSWIKSMVESGARSGQISATKDLVKLIENYLDMYTMESTVCVTGSSKEASKKASKPPRPSAPQAIIAHQTSSEIRELREAIRISNEQMESANKNTNNLMIMIIVLLAFVLFKQWTLRKELDKIQTFLRLQDSHRGMMNQQPKPY